MKNFLIIPIIGLTFFTNQTFAENEIKTNILDENSENIEKSLENEKLENLLKKKIKNIQKGNIDKNIEKTPSLENIPKKEKSYPLTIGFGLTIFFAFIFGIFGKNNKRKELMKIVSEKSDENEVLETKRLEKKVVPKSNEKYFWKKMNELIRSHIENETKKDLNNLTNIEIIEVFYIYFEKNNEVKEILLEVNRGMYGRSKKNKENLAKQLHILINIKK